jgi:peptidyl-prolyl cis-trans isomerase C
MSQFFSTSWTRVSAVAAITLLLGACGKGQQAAAPQTPAAADKSAAPAVAVINGDSISRDEFDTYLKALLRGKPIGDATPEEKNQVLDQMINMQLLAGTADKDGLDKDADVTNRLALARLQILADAAAQKYIKDHQPTDQDLHAQYDSVPDKTEYHAAHILVPTKEKAEMLIKKLKGGANFADLAKAESTDNSKNQGGDLGWFTTSKMVKPFGDAVKGLKKGEITPEPVQTQFGWHVIKLEDTRDAAFDEMKPQLSNAAMQKSFQAHIDDLKKNAKIEKNL